MTMSDREDPVRNLIVYGDGRVEEVPFRLAGNYYVQHEDLGDGRQRERVFVGQYARGVGSDECDPEICNDAPYTMVYVERAKYGDGDGDIPGAPTVNGTPIRVDVPASTRKSATTLHRECVRSGGHEAEGPDRCKRCGLTGYVIRAETYRLAGEEEARTSEAGLRDQLVKLSDENRTVLAENARLRRRLERAGS